MCRQYNSACIWLKTVFGYGLLVRNKVGIFEQIVLVFKNKKNADNKTNSWWIWLYKRTYVQGNATKSRPCAEIDVVTFPPLLPNFINQFPIRFCPVDFVNIFTNCLSPRGRFRISYIEDVKWVLGLSVYSIFQNVGVISNIKQLTLSTKQFPLNIPRLTKIKLKIYFGM